MGNDDSWPRQLCFLSCSSKLHIHTCLPSFSSFMFCNRHCITLGVNVSVRSNSNFDFKRCFCNYTRKKNQYFFRPFCKSEWISSICFDNTLLLSKNTAFWIILIQKWNSFKGDWRACKGFFEQWHFVTRWLALLTVEGQGKVSLKCSGTCWCMSSHWRVALSNWS